MRVRPLNGFPFLNFDFLRAKAGCGFWRRSAQRFKPPLPLASMIGREGQTSHDLATSAFSELRMGTERPN